MSEPYDYFKCEVCGKKKTAGNEKVREIAYSQRHAGAQNGEAKLIVYSVLVCAECDTDRKMVLSKRAQEKEAKLK